MNMYVQTQNRSLIKTATGFATTFQTRSVLYN